MCLISNKSLNCSGTLDAQSIQAFSLPVRYVRTRKRKMLFTAIHDIINIRLQKKNKKIEEEEQYMYAYLICISSSHGVLCMHGITLHMNV